jgi:CRISPR-associated protein Cas5d
MYFISKDVLRLYVEGPQARWTNPYFRGEPYSFDCMTPTAAQGIVGSIYWHPDATRSSSTTKTLPAYDVQVDRILVLAPIQDETLLVNGWTGPAKTAARTQQHQRNLKDVKYVIEFRFVQRAPLSESYSLPKAQNIFRKRARRGGDYFSTYLGCSEFKGSHRLVEDDEELPTPINVSKPLGRMPYSRSDDTGNPKSPRQWLYFDAELEQGVLTCPPYTTRPVAAVSSAKRGKKV